MSQPLDIFQPQHYARTRLPLAEAETLPPWCYTSKEFFAAEMNTIFRKTWNFVGRVDEVGETGAFMALEVSGEPIILVRGGDGAVRAFANTCRHRGARLLCGEGRKSAIACPYHGWTYGLAGELRGAPGMDGVKNFDKADYGLIPLRLETWAGFMFVDLSGTAPPLAEHLGNIVDVFAPYGFEDFVCVRRTEYDLACNWKIYIENAMEDYHTATVHRKSIGTQTTAREETTGEWDAIHMPADGTIAILPTDTTPFPHVATLSGKPARGTFFTVIYPNTFFATTHDCMWWLHAVPLAPDRTRVIHGACFPRATTLRDDFEAVLPRYFKRWEKSLGEDNDISVEQQIGMMSAFGRAGRFSLMEPVVHALDNWVLDRVLAEADDQRGRQDG